MAKGLVQNVAATVVLGVLLFLPAGTLAWPQAWGFLVLFSGCCVVFALWLRAFDPELLAERMTSPVGPDQALRDRLVMGAILVGFAAWFVLMALDARRFGWSHVPLWGQVLGALAIMVAFRAWAGVLRANRFAGTRVRLQPDRGQTVIDTGPYAVVRHPMYSDSLVFMIGTSLLLGSVWGLLGVAALTLLLGARIRGEEAMLTEGLPGYRDYAARVRFRLVPGLW